MTEIGYQHGIVAGMNGLRDLDPAKTLLQKEGSKWPSIDTLADVPLDQWKAWDKMERAFTILVYDHDAAQGGSPPDPPEPPPATYVKVAPIVVREEGGSSQRVCLWTGAMGSSALVPGVKRLSTGQYTDESGALYKSDGDGLEDSSIRTRVQDPALVGARSMDNRSVCECPPVGSPTENTGSWTV
jgi:hypothetical protein